MAALIIFFILFLVVILLSTLSSDNKTSKPNSHEREIVVKTLDLPDNDFSGTFEVKIAGINKYCSSEDIGIVKGIIFKEVENDYNHNAMVIYSNQGKKLGYVPESDLPRYLTWNKGVPYPFVGFIKSFNSSEGCKLYGRAISIQPCNTAFVRRVEKEVYEQIMNEEFY